MTSMNLYSIIISECSDGLLKTKKRFKQLENLRMALSRTVLMSARRYYYVAGASSGDTPTPHLPHNWLAEMWSGRLLQPKFATHLVTHLQSNYKVITTQLSKKFNCIQYILYNI